MVSRFLLDASFVPLYLGSRKCESLNFLNYMLFLFRNKELKHISLLQEVILPPLDLGDSAICFAPC